MSDLAVYKGPQIAEKQAYANFLADANLLPKQYYKQPGNVFLACELGYALGIEPIVAIQQVHVIEGKPSAGANLIGALVRQAGHQLRVKADETRAVATIRRKDDPQFEFRSEWTIERAQKAGLMGKDVWKKFPSSMLKARAISEVAREACFEALCGIAYTPEELGAEDRFPQDAPVTASVVESTPEPKKVNKHIKVSEPVKISKPAPEPVVEAEVVEEGPSPELMRKRGLCWKYAVQVYKGEAEQFFGGKSLKEAPEEQVDRWLASLQPAYETAMEQEVAF